MLILSALPSTRKVKRDWRPLALNSVVLLRGLFGNGIPVSGVLTSPLTALWRHTDSAARKPPGVSVMPLILMDAGPVSSAFFASACSVATVVLRASLLAFRSLTVELSDTAVDFTSAVVFTASIALVLASAARAFAAPAA